jgi:diguanylate cyclase (GGDEF)-like protein
MKYLAILEKRSKKFNITLCFILIGILCFFDLLTGYEIAFSFFYVFPIFLVTWLIGQRVGIVASLVSACAWIWADLASGHPYSHIYIPVWNTLIRLSFFFIITFLLSALRTSMEREKELSRTDYLTGAVNARLFYELAQAEIDRFQRYEHPFTLAYIDLDNFKGVNDQFGHSIGDQVLCIVVSSARKYLRKTDVLARLGGDEFALLLPETDQESARVAISNIQGKLLEEMRQNNWPVTFSIGVLTCNSAVHTTDELVKMADELMYSVKNDSKNAIKYSICAG